MGTNGWLYTDINIRNPSNQKIIFPIDSVAIVGVNEIMKDPADAPESQGSMTLEERGGPITSNITTSDLSNNISNIRIHLLFWKKFSHFFWVMLIME
jgi:hypothetical protein